MAQVTLDSEKVQEILEGIEVKLRKGIGWAAKQDRKVTLTVPEPYDHSIGTDPLSRIRPCSSILDECGEVGVLMGVFEKISKRRK